MTARKKAPLIDKPDTPVKATDAEINRRVLDVYKLLVAGASRATIVQYGSKTWSITDRQVDDYIARAKLDLMAQLDRDKDNNLAMAITRMSDIYQQCYAAKNYKGAITAQIEINKLLGLYAPTKIEGVIGVSVKAYKEFSPDSWDDDAHTDDS